MIFFRNSKKEEKLQMLMCDLIWFRCVFREAAQVCYVCVCV